MELRIADHELSREDFVDCTDGGLPGLNRGQTSECRFSVDDGPEGLHMHQNDGEGWLRFHMDEVDPRRDLVGHGFADTRAGEGLVVGGIAALFAAIAGKPKLAVALVAGGTFLGSRVPKYQSRIFVLRSGPDGQPQVVDRESGSSELVFVS